jgi:SpoVK/Ycf46/Vps4 family AAA+-type ATPase
MPDAIQPVHGIRSKFFIVLLLVIGCRESGKVNFLEKIPVYNNEWQADSSSLASLREVLSYDRGSDSSRPEKVGGRILVFGNNAAHRLNAAAWLGKELGKDLYRIDLALVVSKYIAETEKNLDRIFERAEDKDWILFFDEADALFGKRSKTGDGQGADSGMGLNYLLGKTDNYDGVVILSTTETRKIDSLQLMRFRKIVEIK